VSSTILCLNCGSSSVKFAVYAYQKDRSPGELRVRGKAELIDQESGLTAFDAQGQLLVERKETFSSKGDVHDDLLKLTLDWLASHGDLDPIAAGHRVVHGGKTFVQAVHVNEATLNDLGVLIPLAPLHQPYNLAGIRALAKLRPSLFQVACFDTAFHATLPHVERAFALPRRLEEQGIYRYGFHGLSYAYIASVLPDYCGDVAEGRVVVAHLGSGASLCALQNRKSIASTMGFTALEGLMMGTRCGNLDPGVLLYLLTEQGMDVQSLTSLLYKESGLLGVSGLSADVRTLLAASDDPRAAEAIELFCYRIQRELGAMVAALQGLDALVFTAGIGEHAAPIRKRICESLQWIGVELDDMRNASGVGCLTTPTSKVSVWVIPTDEEQMVANETIGVMAKAVTH